MMRNFSYSFAAALVLLAIGAPGAWAQQQTQQPQPKPPQQPQNQADQPIPAYRSPLASGAANAPAEDNGAGAQELAPDTRPLVGALGVSLGAPKTSRSYWAPFLDLSASAYSNPINSGNSTGWTTWSSLSGGIDLHKISSNSNLVLSLLSGGSFSTDGSGGNVNVQELGIAESLTFRRSSISLIDQVGYLPQAGFGYNGLGTLPVAAGGNLGLQSGFTPNQSILTASGQRISNTSLAEFDTFLTPRSSIVLVGSYGLLHYFDNNLQDTHETTAQAGFNHQMNRKDTVALLYRFDAFRYSHIAQSINDHSVQVSYARRITGRLAFQFSAGPDFAFSQTPIKGSTASRGTGGSVATTGKTTQFFWDLNTAFDYRLRSAALALAYWHGVTGGSGVLAGSVTDNVSGSASRQLTRRVNGTLTIGYSRNTGIAITPTSKLTPFDQTYNYWFSGVSATRTFSRSMNLSLGYQAQYQISNFSFCVNPMCGTSYLTHQIYVDLGWHPRSFISK
jgi:hypothetical protein